MMNRISYLGVILLLWLTACVPPEPPEPVSVHEASITELQQAMTEGRVTARELVAQYLARIAVYENELNATISVNPNALAQAERLDAERRDGQVRGPLHGIPVVLKDNMLTTEMPTTGGALAFDDLVPPYAATLVTRLREAGAIILAKTTHTELAHWVSSGMPGNYSAVGGFGLNPYDPRRDPRESFSDGRGVLSPGGSSSGGGTAASFWAANFGTETSGSILNPASLNMLAAIKPTVGRISRHGIIPITLDQDTAGPMARSVEDAALLLQAVEGLDEQDPATGVCEPADYRAHIATATLKGARIGIPRAFFYEPLDNDSGGLDPPRAAVMDEAIAVLERLGAEIVDVELPGLEAFLDWPICYGESGAKGRDEDCSVVLKYGMQRDFNAWLDTLGEDAPVDSLTGLVEFNRENAHRGAIRYGQVQLENSAEMDVDADRERYERDRARDLRLTAEEGIDAALDAHDLDALLFPAARGANLAARPGYPSVIVPFGRVPNEVPGLPEGFGPEPAPFGVTFTGTACSEPRLVALAHAFEQATDRRIPPPAFPALP